MKAVNHSPSPPSYRPSTTQWGLNKHTVQHGGVRGTLASQSTRSALNSSLSETPVRASVGPDQVRECFVQLSNMHKYATSLELITASKIVYSILKPNFKVENGNQMCNFPP